MNRVSDAADKTYMQMAVELSRGGFPAPNPHVGCILVKDGEVIGRGFHQFAGGDHAEAMALREAGDRARGATAYVTLEPCNHHGRTPPCSEALIQAGIYRVVVAVSDPNPKAKGGTEKLLSAGTEVETGVCAAEAYWANRLFLEAHWQQQAVFGIKAAVTLDGRIALPNGESQWITGQPARVKAHQLRAEYGAVLVGRATVEADNPRLTVRHLKVANQPVRVVLDPEFKLSERMNVFDGAASTLWVGEKGRRASSPARNVEIVELERLEDGMLDLIALSVEMFRRGHIAVLVEGGARTVSGVMKAGLASELHLFQAPVVFGAGPTWLEGQLAGTVAESPRLKLVQREPIGKDLYSHYVFATSTPQESAR
ncbi:MAG: bifunctional diaminohydroxyphosphoribosylaminopyrimidine deaminase/5-amino-6-(5-phosphoribosylamino)uracil reductase RibD [Fimbriimonadaceae bacterium]